MFHLTFEVSLFFFLLLLLSFKIVFDSIENTSDRLNDADDVQDNAIMGLAYSTFQRILDNSMQILNPIDRLYSMQNYYFRCNNNRQRNDIDDNDGM